MNSVTEHLTKAEQALDLARRDLRAAAERMDVGLASTAMLCALEQQAEGLYALIGLARVASTEEEIAQVCPVGWTRDESRTNLTLLLIGGYDVPREAIASWSDEECEQAEDWAIACHYRASDNDVEVPPVPSWVAHWSTA